LGRVDHLLATGSNDVLVVVGEKERLIPFVLGEYVHTVDLEARVIVVGWSGDF
jgi:16S rRNA processing protein RimM